MQVIMKGNGYIVSDVVNGKRVSRYYVGYKKAQAIAKFKLL